MIILAVHRIKKLLNGLYKNYTLWTCLRWFSVSLQPRRAKTTSEGKRCIRMPGPGYRIFSCSAGSWLTCSVAPFVMNPSILVSTIDIVISSVTPETELQRRFFEDLGGGPLILDPWFCSYFRGKRQADLHGVVELISLGWAASYWIQT